VLVLVLVSAYRLRLGDVAFKSPAAELGVTPDGNDRLS
jgi:hypothetical protein